MWDRASVGDTDTVWGTGEVLGCREHRARIGTKEELQRQGVWGIETVWGTEGQWGPWWCVCGRSTETRNKVTADGQRRINYRLRCGTVDMKQRSCDCLTLLTAR